MLESVQVIGGVLVLLQGWQIWVLSQIGRRLDRIEDRCEKRLFDCRLAMKQEVEAHL